MRNLDSSSQLYSEHFETVKTIVAKFPYESAVSVRESQSAFSNPKVACSNCLHLMQFQLASGQYKTFKNPEASSARIYGHNEKCK
jgi:hypothetical protein